MDANHTLLHFADKPVVHVLEEDRSPFFAWMASPGYLGATKRQHRRISLAVFLTNIVVN